MRTYEQRQALRDASTLLSEIMLSQALPYQLERVDPFFYREVQGGKTPLELLSDAQDHIEEEIAQGDKIERATYE
jgi:hypothetical protein